MADKEYGGLGTPLDSALDLGINATVSDKATPTLEKIAVTLAKTQGAFEDLKDGLKVIGVEFGNVTDDLKKTALQVSDLAKVIHENLADSLEKTKKAVKGVSDEMQHAQKTWRDTLKSFKEHPGEMLADVGKKFAAGSGGFNLKNLLAKVGEIPTADAALAFAGGAAARMAADWDDATTIISRDIGMANKDYEKFREELMRVSKATKLTIDDTLALATAEAHMSMQAASLEDMGTAMQDYKHGVGLTTEESIKLISINEQFFDMTNAGLQENVKQWMEIRANTTLTNAELVNMVDLFRVQLQMGAQMGGNVGELTKHLAEAADYYHQMGKSQSEMLADMEDSMDLTSRKSMMEAAIGGYNPMEMAQAVWAGDTETVTRLKKQTSAGMPGFAAGFGDMAVFAMPQMMKESAGASQRRVTAGQELLDFEAGKSPSGKKFYAEHPGATAEEARAAYGTAKQGKTAPKPAGEVRLGTTEQLNQTLEQFRKGIIEGMLPVTDDLKKLAASGAINKVADAFDKFAKWIGPAMPWIAGAAALQSLGIFTGVIKTIASVGKALGLGGRAAATVATTEAETLSLLGGGSAAEGGAIGAAVKVMKSQTVAAAMQASMGGTFIMAAGAAALGWLAGSAFDSFMKSHYEWYRKLMTPTATHTDARPTMGLGEAINAGLSPEAIAKAGISDLETAKKAKAMYVAKGSGVDRGFIESLDKMGKEYKAPAKAVGMGDLKEHTAAPLTSEQIEENKKRRVTGHEAALAAFEGRAPAGGGTAEDLSTSEALAAFAQAEGFTVTSGRRPGDTRSAHSIGKAIDVRTGGMSSDHISAFMSMARAKGLHVLDERDEAYARAHGSIGWTAPHLHISTADAREALTAARQGGSKEVGGPALMTAQDMRGNTTSSPVFVSLSNDVVFKDQLKALRMIAQLLSVKPDVNAGMRNAVMAGA